MVSLLLRRLTDRLRSSDSAQGHNHRSFTSAVQGRNGFPAERAGTPLGMSPGFDSIVQRWITESRVHTETLKLVLQQYVLYVSKVF